MPAYLLDEDLPDLAAEIVRARGGDARSVRELGRGGMKDDEQLLFAAEHGWALVSRNERDFSPMSRHFADAGLPHAGVLLFTMSIDNRDAPGMARALLAYARDHPGDVPAYMVDYLKPTRD